MYILSWLTSSGAEQNVACFKENKQRVAAHGSVCFSCFHWNLPSKHRPKSCLSIISFMPDCRSSLPYLKGSFQQEPVSRPDRCVSCGSSLQLYVQTWVVTLHFWSLSSSHSHCLKHCNTVTEQWFYLSLTGPVVSLSGLRTPTPSSPGSVSLSHALSTWNTNTHMSCCISRWLAPPRVPQLTVKFWFSRAGRSPHPSSLLDARHNWKTRQTRPPRKQLEDSFSEAACRHGHTFGTHKKDPVKTTSSALFSTALAAPILWRIALFHFTTTAQSTSVCQASARVWVPGVLLSLAQRR